MLDLRHCFPTAKKQSIHDLSLPLVAVNLCLSANQPLRSISWVAWGNRMDGQAEPRYGSAHGPSRITGSTGRRALGPWTGWRGGWDEMRCARRPLIVMALSMSPVLRDPSSVPPQPLSNAPVGRLTRALSTEAAPSGVPPAAGPGYLSRGAISQPLRRYLSRQNRRESSRARP